MKVQGIECGHRSIERIAIHDTCPRRVAAVSSLELRLV